MELHQLRYFIMVCSTRNISKAAEKLFVSQQALSKSMAELSRELGAPLFNRLPRGVEPTVYANALLSKARQLVSDADELIRMAHRLHDEQFSQFNLGYLVGSYSFKSALPTQAIDQIRQRFPSVSIRITEHAHHELIELLLQGQLHAIYSVDAEAHPKLKAILLAQEPHSVLLSRKSPLSGRKEIRLEELRNETMLLSGSNPLPADIMKRYRVTGSEQRVISGSPYHLVEHVRLNQGYVIAGKAFFMNFNLTDMALIPIADLPPIRHELLVARAGAMLPMRARQIIEALQSGAVSL